VSWINEFHWRISMERIIKKRMSVAYIELSWEEVQMGMFCSHKNFVDNFVTSKDNGELYEEDIEKYNTKRGA
jgi:hypothetical protein